MSFRKWLGQLVSSNNLDEDRKRRELILNILLIFSIVCFLVINLIRLIDAVTRPNNTGLPLIITLTILAFFIFLFWLSKHGHSKIASLLLIITYSLPMFYSFILWGADLPAALLLAVLVITLSGILLGAGAAFISTFLFITFSLTLTYLQVHNLIAVDSYWRGEKHELADAIVYAFLFIVIVGVVWLFCREIKKALSRAKQSEKDLKVERDSLEIKVEERTRQIKQMEAEKINQLYRLAEFGRLSSGIFHDLINPLTAVSLNLEQIKTDGISRITSAKSYLQQALAATRKMEDLVASIKNQISRETGLKKFWLNEEIEAALQILSYKARQAKVNLIFKSEVKINFYGDPVKFGQIITNLLANAIDASESETAPQAVIIELILSNDQITISVSDQGQGIAPENLDKIFEPFFSTKKEAGRGLGLGLASTKHIIEKDFNGVIKVKSALGQGSEFIIIFPHKNV